MNRRCSCSRLAITLRRLCRILELLEHRTHFFLHQRKIDLLLWRRRLSLELVDRARSEIDGSLKLPLGGVGSFEFSEHLSGHFYGLCRAHHLIGVCWIRLQHFLLDLYF